MLRFALLVGFAATCFGVVQEQAQAASVCYEADPSAPAFMRLDVQFHSRLTTARERAKHRNPIQGTYSAHGMIVFEDVDPASEEPIEGTITVARHTGARSAFDVRLLFPSSGDQQLYSFDCYTDEASPTPASWQCRVLVLNAPQNEDVTSFSTSTTFSRVNPLKHSSCSQFTLPDVDGDEEGLASADEPTP